MNKIYVVLLLVGALWVFVAYIWGSRHTNMFEAFSQPAPWSLHTMDRHARAEHQCGVVERFPDTEIPNTWIEIVEDTCEDGMPHTSDGYTIRIPAPVWNMSQERRDSVLRHERVHILQRRNPDQWRAFYKRHWGYTLHQEPPVAARIPEDVRAKVRGNPDTWPTPWACWEGRYWFLPMYTDTQKPRLRNSEVRVWDAERGDWCSPPVGWTAKFCRSGGVCPHQWEHPHEIAAELWTDMSDWSGAPAAALLKEFMQSNDTSIHL